MHPLFSDVPRETIEKLEAYSALLVQWQKRINLVGPSTLLDIWGRHFADSLQLIPLLPADHNAVIVDIGTGAGFPGLVLSILGYTHVHLIESDQRKCAFLREVARVTGVSPVIHASRAESVILPQVAVFTSRACGNLSELLNILRSQIEENTICLFHKGRNYTKELKAVTGWKFDLTVHPSHVSEDSVILELNHIRQEVAQ